MPFFPDDNSLNADFIFPTLLSTDNPNSPEFFYQAYRFLHTNNIPGDTYNDPRRGKIVYPYTDVIYFIFKILVHESFFY
jgi:hypothetical protein